MNIGEKIKSIRLEKKLTQKDIALKSEIAEITIRKIESGKNNPTINTVLKIARALDVNPNIFLFDDDEEIEKFEVFKSNRKAFAEQWNKSFRHKKILELMDQLNEKGQEKAIENVEILTKVDEYKK